MQEFSFVKLNAAVLTIPNLKKISSMTAFGFVRQPKQVVSILHTGITLLELLPSAIPAPLQKRRKTSRLVLKVSIMGVYR
jgi:hypothetical protein